MGTRNRRSGRLSAGAATLSAMLLLTATGVVSGQEPIHLGVIVQAGGPGDAVKQMAAQYTQLYPHITVDVTDMQYDAVRQSAIADFTSGASAYDVVAFDYLWMKEYALGGFILPLDDLVAAKADAVMLNDFFQPYVEYGTLNESLWGLPWLGAVYMLFYRPSLLEQAGVPVPTTWDEYLAAATALKGAGVDYGTTLIGKRDDPLMCEYWSIAWSYGAQIFDGQSTATIDSPEALSALQLWQAVSASAPPDSLAMSWPEAAALFSQGRAAMMINFSDSSETLLTAESVVADDVGFALIPAGPTGIATPNLGGWGMGVNADTPNPDAAFDFIAWLNSPEGQKAGLAFGGSSTRVSVLEDPALHDQYPWMSAAAANFRVSVPFPKATNWTDWEAAMAPPLSEALAGQKTAEQALAEAQERLQVEVTREFGQ